MRAARNGVVSVIVLLSFLLVAPIAGAGLVHIHEVVVRGPVHAEFTYAKRTGPDAFGYQDARVKIIRNGVQLVDRPVKPGCGACEVWPLVPHHSLHVRNLDRNAEREVILRLYGGGAHCCSYDRIFKYHPGGTGSYRSVSHDWADAGAVIRDLGHDGRIEFRSADERFFYRFTAFAFSRAPIQVWRFQDGRFHNVTRHGFGPKIRADKRALRRSYLRVRDSRYPEVRGILAAWLADKYLLHKGAVGWRTMRRIERRGEFVGGDGWAGGEAYLRKLRHFLARTGYSR